jgi:hypothetical protein
MPEKVIRIWHGCRVVQVVAVGEHGTSTLGAVGGAGNSTRIDIELDPWEGLIVDHATRNPPVCYTDEQP